MHCHRKPECTVTVNHVNQGKPGSSPGENRVIPMTLDWRLQGQEKYLKDAVLSLKRYVPCRPQWDHDHCEFCGRKFSLNKGDLQVGYVTSDSYHWICSDCFRDFRSEFNWRLSDESLQPLRHV